MNLDQFVAKWKGKKADWDGYYAGQCVDLFRYYCHEVLSIPQPDGVWGAANFWTDFDTDKILQEHFTKIPNTPDFKPKKGDVMVWNFNAGGGFGHIGMVCNDNADLQYFYSFDQNWSRISYCEVVKHSYRNVYGVLRPKGKSMSNMTIEIKLFEKLRDNSEKWDGVHNELNLDGDPATTPLDSATAVIRGYKSQATDARNKLAEYEQEIKNRIEQVSRLEQQVLELDKAKKAEATALIEANKAIVKLRGEYEGRIEALEKQVDAEAKAKGEALNQLAVCKAENKELKNNSLRPLNLADVIKMILPKLWQWLRSVTL